MPSKESDPRIIIQRRRLTHDRCGTRNTPVREVHVKILDTWILEQALDDWLEVGSVDDIGFNHECIAVVASQRQQPPSKLLRHVVHLERRLKGVFADEDWSGRAVRRICRLVCEGNEHNPLSHCSIRQTDPAGKAGMPMGDITARPQGSKLRVVECEERSELLYRQCRNLKSHALLRGRGLDSDSHADRSSSALRLLRSNPSWQDPPGQQV